MIFNINKMKETLTVISKRKAVAYGRCSKAENNIIQETM